MSKHLVLKQRVRLTTGAYHGTIGRVGIPQRGARPPGKGEYWIIFDALPAQWVHESQFEAISIKEPLEGISGC